MKIYLDPGHGGSDPGATGNGLQEKDVTLAIALKINEILLKEYDNAETRLSRTTDKTVTLQERTDDANSWGPICLSPFILTLLTVRRTGMKITSTAV